MATIGEITGGRDGFSCLRSVTTSKDWRNLEGIAEEEEQKNIKPSADRIKRKFRHRRD